MTALGSGGWFSDDTRNSSGTDLVGTALTHAGKPGTVPSAAADLAIAQQISIVNAPAGSAYGTALKIDGTSANTGKSTVSVIDTVTGLGAASLLPTTFTAAYQWYDQPNPTVRTLAFRVGVHSSQWAASQSGFTATRSGESSWDLALVYTGSSATNAWITEHVDASTGTWSVSRQAGNAYFGTPPSAKTLAAWNADATWGPILFGTGAKITGVQFGLGSSQRQCLAYLGYVQTSLLNGGGVIEFGAGDMYVAAQASDFQITLDADSSGTLTTGDIVTWNPTGSLHTHGAVPNLTFGVNAFLTVQAAVNAAQAGRTVYVGAGTYNEQVLVGKSLTMAGANAGVHPVVGANTSAVAGTRGAETILSHNDLYAIKPAAANVTIDGFKFTGTGSRIISLDSGDAPGMRIANNIFANTSTAASTGVVQLVGGNLNNVTLEFNSFTDRGSGYSFYPGGGDFTGLRMANNYFNGQNMAVFWGASALVNGVVQNNEFDGTISGVSGGGAPELYIGQGGNITIGDNYFHDMRYTAFQVGIIGGSVVRNTISHISPQSGGPSGDAFQLWGGESGTAVSSNVTIANNIIHFNDVSSPDGPVRGVRLRTTNVPAGPTIDGTTIHVSNNTFINGGVLNDGTAFAIRHEGDQTKPVDASGNYWSTTSETAIAALMSGPVDFSPYLASGTDTDANTNGFQGSFSSLYVTTQGSQDGATGRIQEGVNLLASGGALMVNVGTYTENVDASSRTATLMPGAGTGQVFITGSLTLGASDTLSITVNGAAVGSSQGQFVVSGAVNLGGASLALPVGFTPAYGQPFTIIDGGAGSVSGTFAQGALITSGAYPFSINYARGGDGFDVVLSYAGRIHDLASGNNFATIQSAMNAAGANDVVRVDAGTYLEDVIISQPGMQILGAGAGTTTIVGKKGGGSATVAIAASNVTLAGFTITREGNNVTDWNDPTLNTVGVAIQGQGVTGSMIRDNLITQMRTGIDIYDSSGHTIRNNVVTDNRTGMIFRNQTDNLTVVENAVTNNWTQGIVFLDASGGTNIPVQRASNCAFFNNNISGNWYGQIVDRQTGGALPAPGANPKNFSGNWFGTATPVVTTNDTTQPGYAAQIPVEFGGTATPPGGQPDIAGPASANFDITPLLTKATDTDLETTPGRGTNGFQGDFSSLVVTAVGTQAGVTGRIQEGLNLLTSGGTLVVLGGSYTGDVDASGQTATLVPGGGTDQVIIDGNFTLGSGDTLPVNLNGVVAGTNCGQWQASGTVTLGGATLSFSGSDVPVPGQIFDLVSDSGLNAVVGTFNGLAEGAVISNFLGSGLPAQVTYLGGAGNDFTLTVFGATVTADGSLVVATPVSSGSPTDTSTVSYSGGNLVFTDYSSTFYAGPGVTVSPDGHTMTVAASTFSGPLVLNGNGSDDVVTLDFSAGDPIPAGGIVVNGGSGNNALKVVGTGLDTVYTPNFGTDGSGVIVVAGRNITFTGLTPVDFNVPGGTFTLSLPNNGNVVDIADGTLVDGTTPALEVSGSSGGVGFENARVRGAAIVIDTSGLAGSADTITVTSADNAHTNTSLTINTGNDAGDVITVNGTTTFPGTVTLNATTVNLNAVVTNAVTSTVATAVNVAAPGRIQEGISVAASTGATVSVGAGTYAESPDTSAKSITLATGSSGTDRVVLNGNLALDRNDTLLVRLNGTVAGTSYGQWQASGTVTLGGAALSLTGSDVPVPGQVFDVVQNAGSNAISGIFNGLAEGAVVQNILGTTLAAQITYLGGTGHDIALSVVGATVTSGGSLVIANPAGSGTTDTSTVTYSGGNLVITDPNNIFYAGPGVTVSPDGHTMTVALSSISGPLVFNGTSGDDLFTFDFSGGSPIPAGGIVVNGGAGNDALRLVGSSFGAVYAPNPTVNGDGVITIGGKTITFTGLEPVDFNVPGGTFTLSLPSAVNVIDVADGFLTDGITPALEISGASGGVGFENARVRGAAITIDTSAFTGADTITLTSADNAHTNTSLTINTGTDAGDSIAVNGAVAFAGPVSLNATTVTVAAAGSVAATGGTGSITIGADALTIPGTATLNAAVAATFKQNSNGTLIDLGGANAAGTLGLSDAELDVVTTPTLNIGDVNSGAVTVSASITRPSSTAISLTSGSTIGLNHLLDSAGGSVTLNGTTITPAATGTDVSMGATGTLAFGSGDNLALAIGGTTADSGYTQLNVAGHVNLTGAVLALSGAYVPAVTDTFTLVNNDGADAITGTFTGLAQGATFAFNGKIMVIHYDGGDGNDVVLSVLPTLVGVTPPANGTYTQSSLLSFTANYSKAMTVDTSGGTPYIGVNIGGTVRNAVYVSGSGTTNLVFHYTVTSSDVDSDGIVVISPIVLNGGTIKDVSGTDAPLAFTSPDTTGVLVNGVVAGQVSFTTGIDPAPGTVAGGPSVGTWDSIRSGMVMAASSDALAFRGYLSMVGGVTALNYQGIWKSPDGTTASTSLLARSGSDAPDTGTTNALFDLLPLNPFINDLGQTTFVGFLRQGSGVGPVTDSTNASGIWSEVGTGANGLRLLLRQDEAVTGGRVTLVAPSGWVAVSNPATTAGPGYAAFNVQLNGTSSALLRVAVSTPAGVTTVTPTTLAMQGDTAPGIGAATGGTFDAMYGNSNDPRMDAAGNVAFLGYLVDGNSGIWYDNLAGTLSAVARTGEATPGLADTFIGFERPSLASSGSHIAFRAFMTTVAQAVWEGDPTTPGGLVAVAKTGDTTLPGTPAGSQLWSIWSPFSNASGKVAFRVSLMDAGSVETRAIVTDANGTLGVIAKVGDAAPGTADTFANFDHPIIGDGNQAAFRAATLGGTTGIWKQAAER